MLPSTLTIRSAADRDPNRFLPLIRRSPASKLSAERYLENRASRQYRPEWTWIAEDCGEILGVAVWWGSPNDEAPGALDAIGIAPSVGDDDRVDLGAQILRAAHAAYADKPAFHFFLPGDWREQADVVADLKWRREAAKLAGLGVLLERLQYEWTPEAGVKQPSGRLVFRDEADDEVFVDLFTRVLKGSLDTTSTTQAVVKGAEAQARGDVHHLRQSMSGERAWWFVALDENNEPVGFGIPSRNTRTAVVGYIGVLPEHRGRGYVDDLLTEITRRLAEDQGVDLIRADTDLDNKPMAAAFERAGYRNCSRRLVFSAH